MKVYYINLDHRTDRRAKMDKMLYDMNVDFERVPGVYYDLKELFNIGGPYTHILGRYKLGQFVENERCHTRVRGVIGCFMSHLEVYKKALESDHGDFLILEDDVTFRKDIFNLINKKKIYLRKHNWDLYRSIWKTQRINGKRANHYSDPVKVDTNHYLSAFKDKTKKNNNWYGGSHFTYVNREKVEKIINYLDKENIFAFDAVLNTSELNVFLDHLPMKVEMPGSKDIPKTT